ncbi:MAG: hypothetical protein IM638_10795 [Bacteroidetes bacterium]|nr:hypothetical protein [Bacteroidota bacterium]
MARIVTTKGISAAISDIISRATERVVIISPYIQLSPVFEERMVAAGQRGVKLVVVCREKKLKDEEKVKLLEIPNVELYTHDNVHTKCYYNGRELVLGSMNFYEYSDKYNRELGISIDAVADAELYNDAARESEEILMMAQKSGKIYRSRIQIKPQPNTTAHATHTAPQQQPQSKPQPQPKAENSTPRSTTQNFTQRRPDKRNLFEKLADTFSHQGYCLRCKSKLQYNPHAPYCTSCYASWVQWENREFKEKFCHCCGEANASSMNRPLCKYCYANGR